MTATHQSVVLLPPTVANYLLNVAAARPVVGAAWTEAARLANYLIGRGVQLASGGAQGLLVFPNAYDFVFKVHGDGHHSTRIWAITLATNPLNVAINGTYTVSGTIAVGGTAIAFAVDSIPKTHYLFVDDTVSLPADPTSQAVETLTCTITPEDVSNYALSFGYLDVQNITIYECPKRYVATGVQDHSCDRKAPVYNGSAAHKSIAALVEAQLFAMRTVRRASMFSFNYGGGYNITGTSYADISVSPPLQTRIMQNGQTTRQCKVYLLAKVTGGTGNVRLTMTNGSTLTFTVSATSKTWLTGNIDVSTDDLDRLAVDGGLRGGTRDRMRIEVRKVTSGTLVIHSLSVSDPPGI